MNRRLAALTAAVVLTTVGVAACVRTPTTLAPVPARATANPTSSNPTSSNPTRSNPTRSNPAPSMSVPSASASPTVVNVYAGAGPGRISPALAGDRPLIYVPNSQSDDVTVIDPATYQIVDHFRGGGEPQHIVPAPDLRTLYITSDRLPGGGIIPIDPVTGKPGEFVPVQDVYNLYFTPDGQQAMVVAEYYKRIDYYDLASWTRLRTVEHPTCAGINHMDYSADLSLALVSCEFANRMIVIDAASGEELRSFALDVVPNGMPQDTRLTPDGAYFLVADMHAHGVYVFDGQATERIGFIPTGRGAHGIYFSRDGRVAYVSNRDEGSVSVIDLATLTPVAKWAIPGGSPDMGGLSADGTVLWLAGRYHGEVYAISTDDGHLLARIPVGAGPHGVAVWPQPGRFSLGHTSNIR
jgi:YVTN family beta-propeller protein